MRKQQTVENSIYKQVANTVSLVLMTGNTSDPKFITPKSFFLSEVGPAAHRKKQSTYLKPQINYNLSHYCCKTITTLAIIAAKQLQH